MSETTFMGVERDKIDWKPVIDYTKCDVTVHPLQI